MLRNPSPILFALALAVSRVAFSADTSGTPSAKKTTPTYTVVKSMLGKRLPAFLVESGAREKLSSKDLNGDIALITYETRESVSVNRAAKKSLISVLSLGLKKDEWQLVSIVDASSSNAFSRFIWRRKLLENGTKEGIPIYGDWDGSTLAALSAKRNESNFVIVDSDRIVRYFAYGVFDADEIGRQKALLVSLLPPRKMPSVGKEPSVSREQPVDGLTR